MTNLDKLLKAVEAGSAKETDFLASFQSSTMRHLLLRAYEGSLDAALALHEALLPGWDALIDLTADVSVSNGAKTLAEYRDYFGKAERSPARGWLLAILRAYRDLQPKKDPTSANSA
ncbi:MULTISPECIES: hypothetical protein [Paracoccus]|uniref:hypothetical protein n=1 Tax=Paracoccus TaxID=265 RepID=UPI00086E4E69|nr:MULTISPECIES: hypothetical protein [Paracoccus]ODT60950.1 MAG: hypothetical protein ABS73_03690 [Paracoccus sp. SCN 68-21]